MSVINLSDIAERAALTFEPVAFEKNVNIRTIIAENLVFYSNPELFDRLIHILLDNAVKHSHNDTEILLALQKNGAKVFLSVNNKGDIIPREDIPHIFDRFYRADKARTSSNESSGYGLGLAIAKSILEKLNGDIVVSSNADNGTTFTVVFS
jgi:signal transduction histidine kinase